jgi:hypothetical protein
MPQINYTKRHIQRTLERMLNNSKERGGGCVTADCVYMEAVLSHDLPGTLSMSTVRKYLKDIVSSDRAIIEAVKYGRGVVYRYKKIDVFSITTLK